MQTNDAWIAVSGLVKIYRAAAQEVVALQSLDLKVARGTMVSLVGPSGSGKSTLLRTLGGLERPSAGRVIVDGRDLVSLNTSQLTVYRREQVGFLWQQTARNLVPYLSARENIELLMTLAHKHSGRERQAWADTLLGAVGMRDYARSRPADLSGGQQQRVAIACALANKPTVLLADEPTGEVDWQAAQQILALFHDLRTRYGLTIVIVTHDARVAAQTDRIITLRDGRTSTETVPVRERTARVQPDQNAGTERTLQPEELVVLDGAGRLQLPGDQRGRAGIGRLARVELVAQGVLIRPADETVSSTAAPTPSMAGSEPHRSQLGIPQSAPGHDGPKQRTAPAMVAGSGAAIKLTDVERTFEQHGQRVRVLRQINLAIPHGSFVALMGPSGSGKTTVLNLAGGLDHPSAGTVELDGVRLDRLSAPQLAAIRRRIGFIFQSFALLPTASAYENVELGLRIAGNLPRTAWDAQIRRCLAVVGLTHWLQLRPYELSGGQQQRIAIARAIAIRPRIIIADEPTGDLDSRTGQEILGLLRDLVEHEGVTLLLATHDPAVSAVATHRFDLHNGYLQPSVSKPSAENGRRTE